MADGDALDKAQEAKAKANITSQRLDEVVSEVRAIRTDLAEFRQEMAAFLGASKVQDLHDTKGFNGLRGDLDEHEKRIRDNERYRWMFPVSTLGSLISAAAAITIAVISIL